MINPIHFVIKPEHRILMCQNIVHMMAYQDIKVTFINPGTEMLPKYLDEQHCTHFKSTIHGNILEWKKLVNLANMKSFIMFYPLVISF